MSGLEGIIILNTNAITIAIDAMSGDHGPSVIVPAVFKALKIYPTLKVILAGQEEILSPYLKECSDQNILSRVKIHHASEVVSMHDQPAYALRNKKDSSMRVALNLVYNKEACACVSAGNTGALMATARYVVKTLPGIDRPAIISPIPSEKGLVYVLDLGANIECQSEHLFQFAVMGSILVAARSDKHEPKVGLLNIGSEAIKGTDAVKQASELLESCYGINYIGFIEGDDLFKGTADVIVCDGFVGNVALKSSEGLIRMMGKLLKTELSKTIYSKLIGLLIKPFVKKIGMYIDPCKYNGGSLLGLRGVVIKSHGGAKEDAFVSAIKNAIVEAEKNVPSKINERVTSLLQDSI